MTKRTVIVKALRRALNSLDTEISQVSFGVGLTVSQRLIKLALLENDRDEMRNLLTELENNR